VLRAMGKLLKARVSDTSSVSDKTKATRRSSASTSCTVPTGPPCRFCLRPRSTKNPTPSRRKGELLHFLADDRAECLSCKALVSASYKGTCKKALQKTLEKSEERRRQFQAALKQYEINFENTGNSRTLISKLAVPQVLEVAESSIAHSSMMLGVFWPESVLMQRENLRVPKDELQEHRHKNKVYRGLLRDSTQGCPSGCIEVRDIDELAVRRSHQVASSSTQLRDGEIDELHMKLKASSSATIEHTEPAGDAAGARPVLGIKRKSSLNLDESDSQEDWCQLFKGKEKDAAPEKKKKKTKKKHTKSTSSSSSSRRQRSKRPLKPAAAGAVKTPKKAKVAVVPKASPMTSGGRRPVYPSEQQRQINDCANKVSELLAIVSSCSNTDGLKTTIHDAGRKLVASRVRVEKKLCDTISYALTFCGEADEGAGLHEQGTKVLADLQRLNLQAEALLRLVESARATEGLESTSTFLLACCRRCKVNSVALPTYVSSMLLHRQIDDLVAEQDWDLIGKSLNMQSGIEAPVYEENTVSMAIFGDQQAKQHLQTITYAITAILQLTSEVTLRTDLGAVLAKLDCGAVEPAEAATTIKLLHDVWDSILWVVEEQQQI
jgi:hypothetical protein